MRYCSSSFVGQLLIGLIANQSLLYFDSFLVMNRKMDTFGIECPWCGVDPCLHHVVRFHIGIQFFSFHINTCIEHWIWNWVFVFAVPLLPMMPGPAPLSVSVDSPVCWHTCGLDVTCLPYACKQGSEGNFMVTVSPGTHWPCPKDGLYKAGWPLLQPLRVLHILSPTVPSLPLHL